LIVGESATFTAANEVPGGAWVERDGQLSTQSHAALRSRDDADLDSADILPPRLRTLAGVARPVRHVALAAPSFRASFQAAEQALAQLASGHRAVRDAAQPSGAVPIARARLAVPRDLAAARDRVRTRHRHRLALARRSYLFGRRWRVSALRDERSRFVGDIGSMRAGKKSEREQGGAHPPSVQAIRRDPRIEPPVLNQRP
jgi:hypothetical protein